MSNLKLALGIAAYLALVAAAVALAVMHDRLSY